MTGSSHNFIHDAAVRMLRRAGYFVGLPKIAPAVGTRWAPSRGVAIERTVLNVELWRIRGPRIRYLTSQLGAPSQTCSLMTWHRWVTRSRARVVEAAAA